MLCNHEDPQAVNDQQGEGTKTKKSFEQLTGVRPPFGQAALFEGIAGIIFLIALVWPNMSVTNLLKGLLIGGFWAVYGFISYLRVQSESPRH